MVESTITGCRPDFANVTNIICSHTADNPSLLFILGLLQGQCVSRLLKKKIYPCCKYVLPANQSRIVYYISNETTLIVCIPDTAMIQCLVLARDQPLNNVYHCLPGLYNYLANIIDKTARVPVFYDF